MKCSNCGSNLNIEDGKCAYCGTANPYFEKHRADMFRFRQDYEKTKKHILEKSSRFAGNSVRVTVIAILVAVDILMILLAGNVWSVMNSLEKISAERNADTHRARLEAYEAERNYIGLMDYYEEHNLYGSDSLSDFEVVYRVCSSYAYIYEYIVELGNEDSYLTDTDRIEYISDNLGYLYKYIEKDEYDPEECFEGEHGKLLEQVKYDLKVLFMAYANISEEEADLFPTMSDGRRQVALERGLGISEE